MTAFVAPWFEHWRQKEVYKSFYQVWREERRKKFEDVFVVHNIRFPHDPCWRERGLSIQRTGDFLRRWGLG